MKITKTRALFLSNLIYHVRQLQLTSVLKMNHKESLELDTFQIELTQFLIDEMLPTRTMPRIEITKEIKVKAPNDQFASILLSKDEFFNLEDLKCVGKAGCEYTLAPIVTTQKLAFISHREHDGFKEQIDINRLIRQSDNLYIERSDEWLPATFHVSKFPKSWIKTFKVNQRYVANSKRKEIQQHVVKQPKSADTKLPTIHGRELINLDPVYCSYDENNFDVYGPEVRTKGYFEFISEMGEHRHTKQICVMFKNVGDPGTDADLFHSNSITHVTRLATKLVVETKRKDYEFNIKKYPKSWIDSLHAGQRYQVTNKEIQQ